MSSLERERFQLERMILFSDAVFAIAITLLVIDIKIPDLHVADVSDDTVLAALVSLIPRFLGFLISFILIGGYWSIHHRLFGLVSHLRPKLLRLNLFFLLFVVLMPFTTGLLGECSRPSLMHLKTPVIVYLLNIVGVGVVNAILWRMVGNPALGLIDGQIDKRELRLAQIRSIVVPSVFALAIPVALVDAYIARFVPLLIPLAIKALRFQSNAGQRRR